MTGYTADEAYDIELALEDWILDRDDAVEWAIIRTCQCGCGNPQFQGILYEMMPDPGDTVH